MNIPPVHKARKRFGQKFPHESGIIRRIVSSISPKRGEHMVETGPGEGVITKELLQAIGRLEAVELDRDLLHPLAEDAKPLRLVGNQPYNISTPILLHLLEQAHYIKGNVSLQRRDMLPTIS